MELPIGRGSYGSILTVEPKHFGSLRGLAAVYKQQGRRKEAVSHLGRALTIHTSFAGAHCGLGVLLSELIGPHAAILHFEQALAAEPDLAEAQCRLRNVLETLNRHEEAITCYRRTLALSPSRTVPTMPRCAAAWRSQCRSSIASRTRSSGPRKPSPSPPPRQRPTMQSAWRVKRSGDVTGASEAYATILAFPSGEGVMPQACNNCHARECGLSPEAIEIAVAKAGARSRPRAANHV